MKRQKRRKRRREYRARVPLSVEEQLAKYRQQVEAASLEPGTGLAGPEPAPGCVNTGHAPAILCMRVAGRVLYLVGHQLAVMEFGERERDPYALEYEPTPTAKNAKPGRVFHVRGRSKMWVRLYASRKAATERFLAMCKEALEEHEQARREIEQERARAREALKRGDYEGFVKAAFGLADRT